MKLLEDFSFIDPDGKVWCAPKDSVINGASIPRPLWSTVRLPYTDDYHRASIVHDVACESNAISRNAADVMFFIHAELVGAVLLKKGFYMLVFVLVLGLLPIFQQSHCQRINCCFEHKSLSLFAYETFLKGKLPDISNEINTLSDETTIDQLDAAIT
ncbi:DUF1353 domain-containing protein [Chlorobium ferrooxidans]|uniref:DUF1353 domain-containing protein n=1 Tax=Chlorobium ferrooxidans TaxID=84205 RepID=UPI00058ED198|nr:DUF1353 domain-containing protein [Chlorobium ferrooxidans]